MRLSFVCGCFDWSHPDLKRCGEFVPCVMAIGSDSWRVGRVKGRVIWSGFASFTDRRIGFGLYQVGESGFHTVMKG